MADKKKPAAKIPASALADDAVIDFRDGVLTITVARFPSTSEKQ